MTRRSFGAIRRLPSKRYQARYVVAGERYKAPHLFTSRGNASTWLSKVEASISGGTWTVPGSTQEIPFFGAYATQWVTTRKLTPKTRQEYRGLLDRILLPKFGATPLDQVTPGMVRDWFEALPDNPTQNAHAYSLLRTIFGTAIENEILTVANPCRIKGAGSVKRAKVITILVPDQVNTLAEEMAERYRVMTLITAYCCLRFGEVTELRRKDFVDGKLKVRRGVTWVDSLPVVGTPKTVAGVREVPVLPSLRPLLAEHILKFAEPGEDGLIFPRAAGGHMRHTTLAKVFRLARKKIGREDLTWHGLRHTGAVIWAQDPQINLTDLMALLGHETHQMALRYQHVVDGKLDEAAIRLDHHLSHLGDEAIA